MTPKIPGPLPFPPLTAPWGDNSAGARHRERADGIERGTRALEDERWENTEGHRRATVTRRARAARRTR